MLKTGFYNYLEFHRTKKQADLLVLSVNVFEISMYIQYGAMVYKLSTPLSKNSLLVMKILIKMHMGVNKHYMLPAIYAFIDHCVETVTHGMMVEVCTIQNKGGGVLDGGREGALGDGVLQGGVHWGSMGWGCTLAEGGLQGTGAHRGVRGKS